MNGTVTSIESLPSCYSLPLQRDHSVCTLYGYDRAGKQIATTNALNQTSLTVYDAVNRPIISVANWDWLTLIDDPNDCEFDDAAATSNLCNITTHDAPGRLTAGPAGGYAGLGGGHFTLCCFHV